MEFKGVEYIDGLAEDLKNHKPVKDLPDNVIYDMLQDRDIDGYKIAKMAVALHEHRKTVKDGLDEDVLEAENPITIMHNSGPDRVTLAICARAPDDAGHFSNPARLTLMRNNKNEWHVEQFFISTDATAYSDEKEHTYVDLAEGIRENYKQHDQKFATDFVKHLANGDDIWDALFRADNNGKIDQIFATAMSELKAEDAKGAGLYNIKSGRTPGSFDYADGSRTYVAPASPKAGQKHSF